MNIKTERINEERVTAGFSQEALEALLIQTLAEKAGVKLDRNTRTQVRFYNEDQGTKGSRYRAEVVIVNDFGPSKTVKEIEI